MRQPTARQSRALRAAAASALTTLLAATAHTVAGGGAPGPAVLLIASLLSMPVALALGGRRSAGVLGTSLAVGGAQAVYHAAFAVFGRSAVFAGPAVMSAHGMPMPGAASGGLGPAGVASGVAALPAAGSGSALASLVEPCMLAMHLAAAIVTVAMLVHGERLLRAIARTIWPRLLRRPFRPLAVAAQAPVARVRVGLVVRQTFTTLRRRGPPVFC